MRRLALPGLRFSLAICSIAVAGQSYGSSQTTESSIGLKEAPGREVTQARCPVCHSLDYIPMNAPVMDRATWQKTIQKMRERFGAPISDDEAAQILDYLGENYADRR